MYINKMSANNQTLIVKHKDRYLVFDNVQAESWGEENVLEEKDAVCTHSTHKSALVCAQIHEEEEKTEYGIVEDKLWKDDAKVVIK